MKTAAATVLMRSLSNFSRAGEAPGASPIRLRAGQKSMTRLRKRASAPCAGSVATTSKPLARKQAAQLAPMTPVPTTATWVDDVFAVVSIFRCPALRATFFHGSATGRIAIFIIARLLRSDGQPLLRAFRERHLPGL